MVAFIASITTLSACKASQEDLFAKARAAVASNMLQEKYIAGIDTAEKLVQIGLNTKSPDDKHPQLQSLFAELVSHFPSAPANLKAIQHPLTWKEYRLAVQGLIDWKSPQDTIVRDGYYAGIPAKESINLAQPKYLEGKVYQGFIPQPHGRIGEAVILICLAKNISPYGFPLAFSGNTGNSRSTDTTRYVENDRGHITNVYSLEFKRDWILSGRLNQLLEKIPFTNEFIYYLIDKVWDRGPMDICLPGFIYHVLGPNYNKTLIHDFLPDIYDSLFGHNPLIDRKALQEGIVSYLGGGPRWQDLPTVFKHVSSHGELEEILKGQKDPTSPLLSKMKVWGFVYYVRNFLHVSYFTDLIISLDRQSNDTWRILDAAYKDGRLSHKPDADPYELGYLIERVVKEAGVKYLDSRALL